MLPILFGCATAAITCLGVCMAARPEWIVLKSRDADDNHPLTLGQIRLTRMAGVGIVLVRVYGLYAIDAAMAEQPARLCGARPIRRSLLRRNGVF